jgi:hypothetical protein
MILPDKDELSRFIRKVFANASPDGEVALRAFYEGDNAREIAFRKKVRVGDLEDVISESIAMATRAAKAETPCVFCPPVCTFAPGTKGAREIDLHEGLCLSVEIDRNPAAGLEKLTSVLGKPDIVVESGGRWYDEVFDEQVPKIHAYWILSTPTKTATEHAELKTARKMACSLIDADSTNITIVHPLRWAGSVWRKPSGSPRIARCV